MFGGALSCMTSAKMGIPDDILLKPGKLNEEEWKIMKTHPTLAYELLTPHHLPA